MLASGRWQAIVKDVSGRRMCLGLERTNRRSRKFAEKFMFRMPVDLGQLVKDHEKQQVSAQNQEVANEQQS